MGKVVSVITSLTTDLLENCQTIAIPIAICMVVAYLVVSQFCDEQSQQKYIKRIKIIAVILLAVFLAPDVINWLASYVK